MSVNNNVVDINIKKSPDIIPELITAIKIEINEQAHYARQRKETGAKYNRDLSAKQIAVLIRNDIKEAVKAGILPKGKYSVRIDTYSMGQSIDITIMDISSPKLIFNPGYIKIMEHKRYFEDRPPHYKRLTAYGKNILNYLQKLHDDYNYDNSDSMTDYFDVNYYGSINYSCSFKEAQEKLILDNY